MRVDDKISQQIDKIRAKERETACCIRNDDSGCVQSSQADCSVSFAFWCPVHPTDLMCELFSSLFLLCYFYS
jgi:hypothetical protein